MLSTVDLAERYIPTEPMKIYNTLMMPNPRRVRLFLAEKDIAVPYEEVDIGKVVNRGPEFRKKNKGDGPRA
jgi:glutathione S-transferase